MENRPNPNEAFPNPKIPSLCYIKNVVKNPRIIIGDYTYYDDVDGADQFEKHVTHFYDFIGDKLIIGKFCAIGNYSHSKLLSAMEFGVWKYLYSNAHYRLTGRVLLRVFPNKPRSSVQIQYDHSFIFNELNYINNIRNRIAHHEPICFGKPVVIDSSYAMSHYRRIMTLFNWMDIDATKMLYGLDHVDNVCDKMMNI